MLTRRVIRPWTGIPPAYLCLLCSLLALSLRTGPAWSEDVLPPRQVRVLPFFFVPSDEQAPTAEQKQNLMRHLEWCRRRYREMLRDQDTFTIAEPTRMYRSSRPLAYYRAQPEDAAPQVVSELLTDLKCNRYTCPYVLLTIVMNPHDHFPNGGGRALNGGYNTGGGIIVLSSFTLDHSPNFQSTLQHEIGHSFGLPHVDVYGYDMRSNDSIMSYNPRHHTKGFSPSPTPGKLIPEDLRGLALNKRAFPHWRFEAARDLPQGYSIAERIVPLGRMNIPDQPVGVQVTTDSGEEFGSKVARIVDGPISPSKKKAGKVNFDANTMWQSAKTATGWVSVEVTFPYEVSLTRIAVHSQYSGMYHAAYAIRIAVQDASGDFHAVHQAALHSVDEIVALPHAAKGQVWRFEFRAGPSGTVVLRGLRFFSGPYAIFPPLVPYAPA